MITLEEFLNKKPLQDGYTLIRVFEDVAIQGKYKIHRLHKNDICHVEDNVADFLILRGFATKINIRKEVS